ncbi:hypothetical protein ACWFMI_25250 [Nocardiopsis terrae]|uniref:hypothetical protein n=1 Tax=Streptomyces sp. NPDC057554 TaxID=3350538 RepID=UPI0036B36BCB
MATPTGTVTMDGRLTLHTYIGTYTLGDGHLTIPTQVTADQLVPGPIGPAIAQLLREAADNLDALHKERRVLLEGGPRHGERVRLDHPDHTELSISYQPDRPADTSVLVPVGSARYTRDRHRPGVFVYLPEEVV